MTICPACTVFEMSPNVNVCDACWGREQSAHTIAQLRAAVRAADAMFGLLRADCKLPVSTLDDAVEAYAEARARCGDVTKDGG